MTGRSLRPNRAFQTLTMLLLSCLSSATLISAAGPRFVDQGDGTVKDTTSGLLWMKHAGCHGTADFDEALRLAAVTKEGIGCGLTDGSKPGDWRLPTVAEWKKMMRASCKPAISDDAGSGCYSDQSSFDGVEAEVYWSSEPNPPTDIAWYAWLRNGTVAGNGRLKNQYYVWPVRDP